MTIPKDKLDWSNLSIIGLISATAFRLEVVADRKFFQPAGITAASFKILAVINKFGAMSPSELVKYLGGTKSNITQRLAFLKRAGLIEINPLKNGDKRKIIISLAPSGKQQIKEALIKVDQYNAEVKKIFKPKEVDNFISFMLKMNKGLDKWENNIKL